MKYTTHDTRHTTIILVSVVWFLVLVLGCDAFVRKFTRRPKKDNLPQEEMVLAPEEYKAKQATAEESYRQYFLFWQSWQDELIYALLERKSQKKQLDCAREAVKNLLEMRALLRQEKEGEFDRYLAQFRVLEKEINDDLYGNHIPANQRQAEMLRRNFFRDFSPQKIKKYLQ